MAFKLFLDGNGRPKFDEKGVPLYAQEGGSDPAPIDVNGLHDQVRARGGEAAAHRKEKEELAARLAAFDGIDPGAAREALEKVRSREDGQALETGKTDEIQRKAEAEYRRKLESMARALKESRTAMAGAVREKDRMIHDLLVRSAFAGSEYLRARTVLPPEIAYDAFGRHFTVECEGGIPVVVAKDGGGKPIFSASDSSAYAGPEEAIRHLVENHPQRDALLKAPAPNGGSGSVPGGASGAVFPGKKYAELKSPREKAVWLNDPANLQG